MQEWEGPHARRGTIDGYGLTEKRQRREDKTWQAKGRTVDKQADRSGRVKSS